VDGIYLENGQKITAGQHFAKYHQLKSSGGAAANNPNLKA